MPKVSDAYLKERRLHILDAAIVCFARKGFHQTTMEDIGREAGVSPTVAYRYFASKEEIILATVQNSLDRLRQFYETEVEEGDARRALEQIADDHLGRLERPGKEEYYKIRVQLWAEALQNPGVAEKARLLRIEGLEQFAAIVRKGQERGQIDANLDAMAVSIAFAANHDGFVLHWLADPEVDIGQYRAVLMAMIHGLFSHQE